MSATIEAPVAVEAMVCPCSSLLPGVQFCAEHHRYFRNGKELTSVSKVIRRCWPIKKDFEAAPVHILEHARERGARIDRYFSEWLRTGYIRIRKGEWIEVLAGLKAVTDWWKSEGIREARPQVILAGDSEAGTADVVTPRLVVDLKCVSALEPTYEVQMGAYADLEGTGAITEAFLLHVKIDARELRARVRCVPVDLKQGIVDWRAMRDVWRAAQRRNPKAFEKEYA